MPSPISPRPASPNAFARLGQRTAAATATAARFSRPPSEIGGRVFIIACSLGIAVGVVATAAMLLAATAFATASTFVVPLVAKFEGFRDAGGTNAVAVTGSWAMAGAVTVVLTLLLSFFILRRFGSSADRNAPA